MRFFKKLFGIGTDSIVAAADAASEAARSVLDKTDIDEKVAAVVDRAVDRAVDVAKQAKEVTPAIIDAAKDTADSVVDAGTVAVHRAKRAVKRVKAK